MKINRRSFVQSTAAMAALPSLFAEANAAGQLGLTAAGYPYKHVKALVDGRIGVDGCDLQFELDKIGNLNSHIFSGPQTRGVTEVGLAPFMLAYANDGFRDYSLLPIFPLRTFRHKSIFVSIDSGIESPEQLKGKRVGTPGYSQTSLQWIRGMLQDEYGVRAEDIEWFVSDKDSAAPMSGKVSKNENVFPESLSVQIGPAGKDESDMLVDGDVDALFHALEPRAFAEGHPKVRRLFADVRATEQDYFSRTGIFPIMHAVAVRNDLVAKHDWLPAAVFNAYSAAKSAAYAEINKQSFFETLPWYAQEAESTKALMGENFFPYGVDPNRKTLETLFRYSYEQELASRELTIEELFLPQSLKLTE